MLECIVKGFTGDLIGAAGCAFGGSGGSGALNTAAKGASDAALASLLLGKFFPAVLTLGALYYLSKLTYRNYSEAEKHKDFSLFRKGYVIADLVKVLAGVACLGYGLAALIWK